MYFDSSFPADTLRWLRAGVVLPLALVAGACAQFPEASERPTPQTPEGLHSASSLAASAVAWPDDHWWQAYGDAQLNALIEEALRDSPDMAAAAARLRGAEAAGAVAGAALLPQVSANASAARQRQSGSSDWNEVGRATLDFSWEIDFWGRNRASLAAATSDLEASRADAAQARLTLASAIASSYADLAGLYAVRDADEAALAVRRHSAQLFTERFVSGLETRSGVKQAEALLASAEGELLRVDESIGLTRHALAALVGAGPDRGLTIRRPSVAIRSPEGLPAELAVNLLGRRPDVVAARLQAEAQVHRIDSKRAEFYPNVNLSAFIGFESIGLSNLFKSGSRIGSIGPAVSLPIFNGGRLRGELKRAQASYDEAVANYNRTLTQALQDVADAWLSRKALAPRLAKAEEAFRAAEQAYRVTLNRYEGGLASYLEVLTAQDTLLTNQRALTDLQSRAFTLDVAMTRALGGGYRAPRS